MSMLASRQQPSPAIFEETGFVCRLGAIGVDVDADAYADPDADADTDADADPDTDEMEDAEDFDTGSVGRFDHGVISALYVNRRDFCSQSVSRKSFQLVPFVVTNDSITADPLRALSKSDFGRGRFVPR